MDYKIELKDGVYLEFSLESFERGEAPSHDSPGEPDTFNFASVITIDPIEYTDDLETLRDDLTAIIEGDDLQDLMEAEYISKQVYEPMDEDDCRARGRSARRHRNGL